MDKSRDSSDFSRPMLGGIIPVYWLCDKFSPIKPGRLVILSGISPLKLLHERSECSLQAKSVSIFKLLSIQHSNNAVNIFKFEISTNVKKPAMRKGVEGAPIVCRSREITQAYVVIGKVRSNIIGNLDGKGSKAWFHESDLILDEEQSTV